MTPHLSLHPIIIGAYYSNGDEIGYIESAELFINRNEAEIIINTYNCGRFYKLNYATFTSYWKLELDKAGNIRFDYSQPKEALKDNKKETEFDGDKLVEQVTSYTKSLKAKFIQEK